MSTAPSLISEDNEQTNTLALLLPHLALFEGPQLRLLKEHYNQFGNIVHWAPVKGFGRVIIVYATDDEAALAKKEGDRLFLDVDLGEDVGRKRGHQRSASQPAHGLLLRLYPLPPTPLNIDPSTTHLSVPAQSRNFLISPPGSPPEGWQPIIEDAPNSQTLAEDLHRALEGLMLNGLRRHEGKEIILDGGEGGVRVEVEDTSISGISADIEEFVADEGTWEVPGGMGGRIAPTARPPM